MRDVILSSRIYLGIDLVRRSKRYHKIVCLAFSNSKTRGLIRLIDSKYRGVMVCIYVCDAQKERRSKTTLKIRLDSEIHLPRVPLAK
jgi:hypothetical protein